MRFILGVAASIAIAACNGATGQAGLTGSPGLAWRGAWNASQAYVAGDVVESAGSAYVAVAANSGAQPPGTAWDLLAAASVAQSVEVSHVVDPVPVSSIAAPVAVSGIGSAVAVSEIASPVAVSGISSPVTVSAISTPVRIDTSYSAVEVNVRNSSVIPVTNGYGPLSVTGSVGVTGPVSVTGSVAASVSGGPITVTPPDMSTSWLLTGDNGGGTLVTCPDSIAAYASVCRRASAFYGGGMIVTDLVATARDDGASATSGRMAFAYAAASDTAAPRWKVALRYVEVAGGSPATFASVTRSLSGARLFVAPGEALYLADSGDAIVTWSGVRR